jgi:competence protein ComGF
MKKKSYETTMSADQMTFTREEGHCFAFHLRNLSRGIKEKFKKPNNYYNYNMSSYLKKGGHRKKDTKSEKNNNDQQTVINVLSSAQITCCRSFVLCHY